MGRDLGTGFEIKNFAVEGTTTISSINTAYAKQQPVKASLAYDPDVVVLERMAKGARISSAPQAA